MTAPKTPARRRAAKTDEFKWLTPASSAELTQRFLAAGDGAYYQIREDAKGGLRFRVAGGATPSTASLTDINETHICPIDCPH